MENFEYSIQLNDRDWAEFYFVSEECRLIPPALAAAEEHLLSDPEEGEADGKKDPLLAHPKASRLASDDLPGGRLFAEDALSGSEDETDLSSVGRFLCRGLPSQPSPNPFSAPPLNPQPPGPTASVAEEEEEEDVVATTVGCPMDPKTKAEAHVTQDGDSEEPHAKLEVGEKFLVPLPLSSSPAATMESPAGAANVLKSSHPQDHTASATCKSPGSTSDISGKPALPKRSDDALDPSSLGVSSVLSPTSGEAGHPEKESLQVALTTPFQKTRSLSSVQVMPRSDNSRARTSRKNKRDVLKTEMGEEQSRSLIPNIPQEVDQAKDNGLEGCPGGLEEGGSLEVDHRGTAPSSGKMERQNHGEPCLHLGTAVTLEGECLTKTQENPGLVPYPPKLNDSSEEALTNITWPEVYDYFFSDDLHEIERPPSPEGKAWKTSHQSQLPAMSGPEMYEYFFQDVGEFMTEEETWSQVGPLETSLNDFEELPSNVNADPMGFPEVCEHFFAHQPQDKSSQRTNILAVRASELGKAMRALTSLVGRPVRFLQSRSRRRRSQATVMLVSPTPLDATSPRRPEHLGVAVFKPERPLQLVLTPRDLCLGFVALASWAVKTSDLHSPDAWKIVLLANFGTLSAIRCFRRQVVMEKESHHES
ncbi:PGC-1 and ERR-induced regulator in muscle protein 1 [Erythrolamprus reginae]|uniref:PGC-1 and ERR-induced regulator in muscle protein 1 n=1 Tax=Erythrolamprus reginae TaxID=121349 RepID=UPI00396C868A